MHWHLSERNENHGKSARRDDSDEENAEILTHAKITPLKRR
jgi:hypothetical protein